MTDFDHTLQRRDGGQMKIGVKPDSLTLTIAPPVTPNEKEAMDGLKALADALKRDVHGSDIQSKDGAISLTIKTPSGRDNALAMVAVSSLETHGAINIGESKRFETALHTAEQQAQKAPDPVSKDISDVQRAAAAIGDALKGMVKADNMHAASVSKVAHAVSPELPDGQLGRA